MSLPKPAAPSALPALPLIAAAMVLSMGMGLRQSFGLFLQPMNQDLGLGLGVFSLAMAIQQLIWGLAQPLAGMANDRFGIGWVLACGFGFYALGLALFGIDQSAVAAYSGIGFLMGLGVSACGFAVVLSAVAKLVPPERRSVAMGLVSAGGSVGQFALAPISGAMIGAWGWLPTLWIFVAIMAASIPIGFLVSSAPRDDDAVTTGATNSLDAAIKSAFRDPSYRLLSFGFFVCGFHVSFVATHLPGMIASCGLTTNVSAAALALIGMGNMIGSYGVGHLGQYYRLKRLLSAIYLLRALTIGIFLLLPKTQLTFLVVSGILGITWLSTVAPTNGLVAKLHGARYVSTLFGFVFLIHQVGGFLGAWVGGLSAEYLGSYDPVWLVAAGLAVASALAHWPIREDAPVRATPASA